MNDLVVKTRFIHCVEDMKKNIKIIDCGVYRASKNVVSQYNNIVFESAQGLLLGEDKEMFFPHLTPSNPGLSYIADRIIDMSDKNLDIEVVFVIRSYMTRHGNGLFPSENPDLQKKHNLKDKKNVENEFQGKFRYGNLDWDLINMAIQKELQHVDKRNKVSLAVTHLDEISDGVLDECRDKCIIPVRYCSYGETAEDVRALN